MTLALCGLSGCGQPTPQTPEPPAGQTQAAPNPALISTGKMAAMPCSSCHDLDGTSHNAAIPSLGGLQQEYLAKALNDYFNGKRHNSAMSVFRTSFTPQKIQAVTAYFSSLEPQPTTLAATGNAQAGQKDAVSCARCHGADGNSPYPAVPSLAGQNPHYLVHALRTYRDRQRDDAVMHTAIQGLSEEQFINISAYFAAQKPRPFAADDHDPAATGAALTTAAISAVPSRMPTTN